ncbi:hypothetical protein [Micromonospora globbae]|uniref:Type II toxin-antitoxin system HicA family toxin n=1 Tax=Micromonospora globbae TaxID=1894969 RepID=A0A420EWY8_9ACTN|nr:hypothetical protein [Micromonospora globbae]RKF25242.1 hypothetical protein D7I43_22580 [Micromonospora globbae]
MKRRSIAADLRPVVAEAEAAGWRLVAGRRHPRLVSPRGRLVVLPATPSDYRAARNARAQVRRVIREEADGLPAPA